MERMNMYNEKDKNFKQLPRINTDCFGCGPYNPSGLQMKFFTDEKSLISQLTVPDHLCGWSNLVHGGVISTILDEVMSWSAMYLLKKIILTKSITVDFIKPIFVGTDLKVEGRILQNKNDREAIMEGFIYNAEGQLCANSTGNYSLFTTDVAERLGLFNKIILKNFEKLFD